METRGSYPVVSGSSEIDSMKCKPKSMGMLAEWRQLAFNICASTSNLGKNLFLIDR